MKKRLKNWDTPLAFSLIGVISLLYLVAVLLRHFRLESFGYDLGIYAQEVYLLSQFKAPYSTIKIPNMIIWGDHWTPSMAIFSPIVWLFGNAELVLVISQVFFLVLAGLTLWKISKRKTSDNLFSLVLLSTFLIFYGVQNAIFFDAHPFFFAAMLLPPLYLFLSEEKWLSFFTLSFLMANFKENIPLYLIALGLYLVIKRKYKQGLFLLAFYALWFLVIVKVLIPHFSPSGEFAYSQEIPNLGELIKRLFYPAIKIKVALLSFWNYSFLPIFSPFSLVLSAANFLENFLGEGILAGRWGFDRHYKAILGPALAIGAIEAYLFLKKRKKNFVLLRCLIIINMIFAALFNQYYLHLQLNMLSKRAYWNIGAHKREIHKLLKYLSYKDGSIASQNNLVPHLSNRDDIYLLSYGDGKTCHFSTNGADYLLVDLSPYQSSVNFLGCSVGEINNHIGDLLKSGEYAATVNRDDILLLRKNGT